VATRMANARRDGLFTVLGWTAVPLLLVTVWELVAYLYSSPWILPRATSVLACLVRPLADHFRQGSLLGNTFISLLRVSIGFALAAAAGVPLGLAMGMFKPVRSLLEPVVELLRPLCPIAWLPFTIAVFGIGTIPDALGLGHTGTVFDTLQLGMVFVLFWGAFFPIIVNTLDGVTGVRRDYVLLARMLGANHGQIFRHVYLPAALPRILTGLRQGIGTAWFVIIAAEMLPGTESGIGYLLQYAGDQSEMAIVVSCMIIIGSIGAALSFGLMRAFANTVRWQGRER